MIFFKTIKHIYFLKTFDGIRPFFFSFLSLHLALPALTMYWYTNAIALRWSSPLMCSLTK